MVETRPPYGNVFHTIGWRIRVWGMRNAGYIRTLSVAKGRSSAPTGLGSKVNSLNGEVQK